MKKYKIIIVVLIIIIIALMAYIVVNAISNQNNDLAINNDNQGEQTKLKEAKYTPDEMLSFFKGESSPDDMEHYYDIILNWYDYYPKDTLFINRYSEKYTYDEYMLLRDRYDDYQFKTSVPVVKKEHYTPILEN